MKNRPNSSYQEGVELSSLRTRGKKKRDKKRIAINIIASCVLALSTLALCAMTIVPELRLAQPEDIVETASGLEDLVTSPSADVSYILVAGLDYSEELTDVIMLVCFDHKKNEANVLQIPRDTFAGTDIVKINAAYHNAREGEAKINALRRRIYNMFGLPVDHFVTITLEGFRDVIDSVGGITITLDRKMYVESSTNPDNPWGSEKFTIGPGTVTLNGKQAEGFMRNRSSYDKGDIGRVEAQQTFYAQFMKKIMSMSTSQALSIAQKCYNDVTTDMSVKEILGYVSATKQLSMDKIRIVAVPGQGGEYYNGMDCYSPYVDEYVELANKYFVPYSDPIVAENLSLVELHTTHSGSWVDEDGNTLGELEEPDEDVASGA